ncbi:unnamed protein product [Ectocarpus sp. CCAP 1310/34]|nr:unnamed protein product [Ectocarpus sp. CCAP 1310/34]
MNQGKTTDFSLTVHSRAALLLVGSSTLHLRAAAPAATAATPARVASRALVWSVVVRPLVHTPAAAVV